MNPAKRLTAYFRQQQPYEVVCKYQTRQASWRFFFIKNKKDLYILDINEEVLKDQQHAIIVRNLEQGNWKARLVLHPDRVLCLGNQGFSYEPRDDLKQYLGLVKDG